MTIPLRPTACLTFDLHDSDRPDDIEYAAAWLEDRAYPATFFIPAALFDRPALQRVLRRVAQSPLIECASHSYAHSLDEIGAMMEGRDLGFLVDAYARHADTLGHPPRAFRAPCWVPLEDATLDTLAELGYTVDSSATPGRPAMLSSFVGHQSWRRTPRSPHWIRPTLLEVPQTTRYVPFAVPTFMTLRQRGSRLLARHLGAEVARDPAKVLVTMLHVGDLNTTAPDYWRPPLSWKSFVPRRGTGFALKYAFRETRRPQVVTIVERVLIELEGRYHFCRMQDVFDTHTNASLEQAAKLVTPFAERAAQPIYA